MKTDLLAPPLTSFKEDTAWFQQVGIVIPTFKAERHWAQLQSSLALQGVPPDRVLVIDSNSPDRTTDLAREAGYHVVSIPQKEFNHGGTRQLGLRYLPKTDLVLYITQDVVFDGPDSILRLCQAMDDPTVGAAHGRQLPRLQASPIERHARLFNYPSRSHVRVLNDRHRLGIRTAFFSNSFSVYRRAALEGIGGFLDHAISGEDFCAATGLLIAGWKIAYVADATVIHSHPLKLKEEFQRYFDFGAQHAREPWMLQVLGSAGGEGLKFLRSEMRYLWQNSPRHIPYATLRTASKLLAYRLGLASTRLPRALNLRMTSQPAAWK